MIEKVCLARCAMTACFLVSLTAVPNGISGQAMNDAYSVNVRVMIPDNVPAFDPDVATKHQGAKIPQALVFPEAVGEVGVAVIMLNPRHARVPTYLSALALLRTALSEGRTEIFIVSGPVKGMGADDASLRASELRRLTASEYMPLPGFVSSGRMIEIVVSYEPEGG